MARSGEEEKDRTRPEGDASGGDVDRCDGSSISGRFGFGDVNVVFAVVAVVAVAVVVAVGPADAGGGVGNGEVEGSSLPVIQELRRFMMYRRPSWVMVRVPALFSAAARWLSDGA